MAKYAICLPETYNQNGVLCKVVDGGDAEILAMMGDNGLLPETYNRIVITDEEYAGIVKETHTFGHINKDNSYVVYDNSSGDNEVLGSFTKHN